MVPRSPTYISISKSRECPSHGAHVQSKSDALLLFEMLRAMILISKEFPANMPERALTGPEPDQCGRHRPGSGGFRRVCREAIEQIRI